tara:strand:+ start:1280 stop:1429 length:150 start_codon:yes stop_codon:yes gene_type:complete
MLLEKNINIIEIIKLVKKLSSKDSLVIFKKDLSDFLPTAKPTNPSVEFA